MSTQAVNNTSSTTSPQSAQTRQAKQTESRSLLIGLAGLVLGVGVSLLLFQQRPAALSGGELSVGFVAALLSVPIGAIAFLTAYLPTLQPAHPHWFSRTIRGINVFAMCFAHIGIVFLAIFGAARIFQQAFLGLELDHVAASALVGIVVAVVSYMLYASGGNISTETIPMLLIILMVTGSMTSMLTAENKEWWHENFSALGGGNGLSASTFNLTMIIAGIILASMSSYLATDLNALAPQHRLGKQWKINVLKTLLILMGLSLVLLGVVDVALSVLVHNIGAYGLGIVFMLLILALPLWLPGLSWAFYLISYGMLAALIAFMVLVYPVGYMNITAFELIAAGLVFTWFTLFVRQIGTFQTVQDPPAVAE